MPLPNSSRKVSGAVPRLSRRISHLTFSTAYTPFTPSNSGQRSPPTYYRGCWHVVSRGLFNKYHQTDMVLAYQPFSLIKEVYNPKAVIPHAASLRQACAHCGRFSTAASRRSMARVAVPFLGVALSRPLPVIDLVVHYTANYLIGRRPILKRIAALLLRDYGELPRLSTSCAPL